MLAAALHSTVFMQPTFNPTCYATDASKQRNRSDSVLVDKLSIVVIRCTRIFGDGVGTVFKRGAVYIYRYVHRCSHPFPLSFCSVSHYSVRRSPSTSKCALGARSSLTTIAIHAALRESPILK